jgi:hypothetical protein
LEKTGPELIEAAAAPRGDVHPVAEDVVIVDDNDVAEVEVDAPLDAAVARLPRRDIDAVAMDVAVLDDHVAEIDADMELDPLLFRGRGVAQGHPALQRKRAGDRLDDAGELDQHAVAWS